MEILVESKQQTELFNFSFYCFVLVYGLHTIWILSWLGPQFPSHVFHGQCIKYYFYFWSQVYFAGLGCLKNVRAALCRGRVLKCSRCGRPGATIGCRVDRCPKTYHLVSLNFLNHVILQKLKIDHYLASPDAYWFFYFWSLLLCCIYISWLPHFLSV